MRPIWLTSFGILALLAGSACDHRADGHFPRKVRSLLVATARAQGVHVPARPGDLILSFPVKGWANTREDAEQRALENARTELPVHLAERDLALDWRPSTNYIKDNLVKEGPEYLQPEDFQEPVGRAQGVRLLIGITAKDWQQMLREDRQMRSESRMLVLAKLLLGFVAFLGAVAGYLRLEEMTKGYYTAWLRLATIGFVTAVGAGIWWFS
jgi:hypothetical protein